MNREEIFLDILKRFNNQEGTISKLVKEYQGYTRDKFNDDIKKRSIIKNPGTNQYIYNDKIEGQIDITEIEEKEKVIVKPKEIIKESLSDTRVKPGDTKDNQYINGSVTRKKKTFEIDTDLEQLIRVSASIEDITINDYVNKILRASIPVSVKIIVKG